MVSIKLPIFFLRSSLFISLAGIVGLISQVNRFLKAGVKFSALQRSEYYTFHIVQHNACAPRNQ